ncbi:MAG: hypothetical protein K6G11_07140 [Lachnospiraceae bacterium]|nr:hypothetical protein [Lachnospiraceae bacterium]
MKISFEGFIKTTESSTGVWANILKVVLNNGKKVDLDRDITEFTIGDTVNEKGYKRLNMEWKSVYTWDSENSEKNYNIKGSDFNDLISLKSDPFIL